MGRRIADSDVGLSDHPSGSNWGNSFFAHIWFQVSRPDRDWAAHLPMANYDNLENEKALRTGLDLVEEKRDQAYLRMATFKQRVSQYFNKRVKHRNFQVGDLVLKAVNQSTKNPNHGSWVPTGKDRTKSFRLPDRELIGYKPWEVRTCNTHGM